MNKEEEILNRIKQILPTNISLNIENLKINFSNNQTSYSNENKEINLNNGYLEEYVDGIYNATNQLNFLFNKSNEIINNNNNLTLNKNVIQKINENYHFVQNNKNITEEVTFNEKELEMLRFFIISHEAGHAIFNDKYNFNPSNNNNGINFNNEETNNINKILNIIDSTNYINGKNVISPGKQNSLMFEIVSDLFGAYLLYKEFGDNITTNNLLEKIKELRYKTNYLNNPMGSSTHNTELVFSNENLSKIRGLVAKGENLNINDIENLSNSIYIETLQKYGLVAQQEEKENLYNITTIKDVLNEEIKAKEEAIINIGETNISKLNNEQINNSFEKFVGLFNIKVFVNNSIEVKNVNENLIEKISNLQIK